jgi:hypothetical protein
MAALFKSGFSFESGFDAAGCWKDRYVSGQQADGYYADDLASEPVLRREFERRVEFIRRPPRRDQMSEAARALLVLPLAPNFFCRTVGDYETFLNALLMPALTGSAVSVVSFCARAVSSLVCSATASNCLRA